MSREPTNQEEFIKLLGITILVVFCLITVVELLIYFL